MTNVLWTIRDGCQVRISDMSDSHLVNAANMIVKSRDWRKQFLPHIVAEFERRGIKDWLGMTIIDDATMIEIGEEKWAIDCPIIIHRADVTTVIRPKNKRIVRVDRTLRKRLRRGGK